MAVIWRVSRPDVAMPLVMKVPKRAGARPLGLPPERATGHVLENPDIAAALLDFARANGVGHIIMGARSSSALRRYLGSVSARVVAEAPCTVTVVRGESRT
jgi:nucleotide-binding universal stress UspA family protein